MPGAVQKVQISVGQPVELDDRFNAPTLWSSTSFIFDEVIRVGGDVTNLKMTMGPFKVAVDKIKSECERLAKVAGNTKFIKVLSAVSKNVRDAAEEIGQLKEELAHLKEARLEKDGKVSSPTSADELDDLLEMLEGSPPPPGEKNRRDPFLTPVKGESKDGESEETKSSEPAGGAIGLLLEEIKKLKVDVGMLKACSEDRSIKFSGLGIRSIQECLLWVNEHFETYVGCEAASGGRG